MWHRRHFLSGAAASAICALPLGKAFAQAPDAWAKVEENAKKEGALQVYSVIATSPVVAMVNGFAVGGGNVLALMCDLTIASRTEGRPT